MAVACIYLMELPDERYQFLLAGDRNHGLAPVINIGVGKDVTIAELAELIKKTVGYKGNITYDPTKPDGTSRKLMDISRLHALGWSAATNLQSGLINAYKEFCK